MFSIVSLHHKKIELDYYHLKLNVQVVSRAVEQLYSLMPSLPSKNRNLAIALSKLNKIRCLTFRESFNSLDLVKWSQNIL